MPKIEELYPEYIRLDGDTQPREKIDPELCEEYGERMKAGDKFPPLDVYFDGKDYWLADGFHRLNASFHALPGKAIRCNVFEGSLQDAQWHSYGVNKTHGQRRINPDKARAVLAALRHPKSSGLSDSAIAEHVGVRRETVLKYRHAREADLPKTDKSSEAGESPDLLKTNKSDRRTGRDGRTINTTKIGKNSSKKQGNDRGVRISRNAHMPRRGHSEPNPMIPLQLSPNNPRTAAATLWQLFPRSFIESLITDLSQRLSTQGES